MEDRIREKIETLRQSIKLINDMLEDGEVNRYLEGKRSAYYDSIYHLLDLLRIDQSKPLPQDNSWAS